MDANERRVAEIVAARDGKPKHAGGRPPKTPKVDDEAIANLAAIMCTMDEIALITGLSVDTLERRFAGVIEKGRAEGRMSLRRQQYKVAMTPAIPGSATMLVWLGKTVLGQREESRVEITGAAGGPIAHADVTSDKLEAYALEALATVEAAERICAEGVVAAGEPAGDGVGEPLHPA